MACWPVKVQTVGCMDLNLNYSTNDGGNHIMLMSVIYDRCQSCMKEIIQGVFFNWAPPEFAKCWPVSN